MSWYDESGAPADGAFRNWARRPTLMTANAMYLLAAAALMGVGMLSQLARLLFPGADGAVVGAAFTALYEIGFLLIPVALYARRHPGVSIVMRVAPPSLTSALLAAIAAAVGVLMVNNLGVLWMLLIEGLGGRLSGATLTVAPTAAAMTAQIFLTGVLPGVCEEVMFRGMILSAWERRGTRYALVVSTLLFAALHGSIEGLPTQLIVGFAMGYLVICSGSLYTGMIYHTVHNSLLVIMSATLGDAGETAVAYDNLFGYIGGWYGVAATALSALVLGAVFAALLIGAGFERARTGRPFEAMRRLDDSPMDWRTLIVLLAGLLTVGCVYLLDFLSVARVL